MATKKAAKKTSSKRASSSGSDPKSKGIVKKKMARTMDEYKHHKLKSGPGGKAGAVKNRKQAIAIGLSEARKSGAKIPAAPGKKKATAKKKAAPKKAAKKKAR